MEITLIIKSFIGLVALLLLLITFLFYAPKKKKVEKQVFEPREKWDNDYKSLVELLVVIKNKQSSSEELSVALDLVMKYHGTIHTKLGLRTHPEFDIYGEILFRICRHPNINKNILLKFNRDLEKINEEYKREINDCVTKGLNSRGF
ncbi:hypothetical protein MNB_SM-4-1808 [hydrothermal vent metagenome]|uniref:Uncharacterized protein n=1 Tax=hydrothermal vent metagenome TaxID=652676 RepID=A0A1W1CAD4_9ZZZZ